ncbi:DEKNAAC102534 [Brettanomyces naardenensis]|uniref:DEKNAAC102534 n=1 Tax=Brettanomyces naardenensis TaxID=13370 RepID=A0A448YL91_BRENA|nr:DEKNAAC102534 [Brettanomyces naardenensis]
MLFFSFFKTLVDQELKNDVKITGTLRSIDQYLNIKLDNVQTDVAKYPHFVAVRSVFIRGSTIRYIHLNPNSVDTNLLQDASRREAMASSGDKIVGR